MAASSGDSAVNSQIENSNNPFYLHQSDNPGINLVSQSLTGDNYNTWRRSMLVALNAKNKSGFVDGSIIRPTPLSSNLNAWIRSNNMVISWIINALSKEIAASVLYHETAREVWLDLEERFAQRNGPKIYQLKKSLVDLSQGSMSVTAYFTQLKTLWDELSSTRSCCSCGTCTCGGTAAVAKEIQDDYVLQFLVGLNESFAQVRSQILLMDPLPSINKAFSLIVQEERQRSISITSQSDSPSVTLAVQSSSNRQYNKKPRPQCTHCNMLGHTKERCYKLHGYPPGYNRQRNDDRRSASTNAAPTVDETQNVQLYSLSTTQCQQLLAMLTNQLQSVNFVEASTSINNVIEGIIVSHIMHSNQSISDY